MMSISILFSAVDRFYFVSENLDEADLGRDYVALWSTEKMRLDAANVSYLQGCRVLAGFFSIPRFRMKE